MSKTMTIIGDYRGRKLLTRKCPSYAKIAFFFFHSEKLIIVVSRCNNHVIKFGTESAYIIMHLPQYYHPPPKGDCIINTQRY